MKVLFFICVVIFPFIQSYSQDVIKMEKSGGIYLIPCKVNGLPLKFIFDTGASDVSISLTEALFMLKNGYLKESDIRGTVYYSIANGEIAEGTKINIQKIEVGKQSLYNVEASIVHSTEAPLLFGQSAMERFGKFTMDYSNSNLIIGSSPNTSSNTTNSSTIKSVKIGTQTWMTENLNVDRFRNGDLIAEVKTHEEWVKAGEQEKPAWCYYANDQNNGTKYGKQYNWYAVKDPRGLAPDGWHIPSLKELQSLESYLGSDSGKKLKTKQGWAANGNGFDQYGFSGLPGGWRAYNDGNFSDKGESAIWWSSTFGMGPCYLKLSYYSEKVKVGCDSGGGAGFSVRCIKD